MKTTKDPAGRVVIPKSLRERESRIEIEPAATPMSLTKTKGGLVAVPERRLPPLTDDDVRATLERSRR